MSQNESSIIEEIQKPKDSGFGSAEKSIDFYESVILKQQEVLSMYVDRVHFLEIENQSMKDKLGF